MAAPALSVPNSLHSHLARWTQLLVLLTVLLAATTGCASVPPPPAKPIARAFDAPQHTPLGQLAQARRELAQARSDSGFHLLHSVDAAFSSRLALIDSARRSLDLQYYAIHGDPSTEHLLQGIREAARRGVRVRLLLDDFNTVGADALVLRLAFEERIEIRLFNPLPGPRASLLGRVLGSLHDIERLQKRMHNKLFIADNAWAIAGGRNLGDAYFGGGKGSNFVDLDVLCAGRIVRDMSASFDRYWNDPLAYPVQSLLSPSQLDRLRQDAPPPAAARVLPPAMDLKRIPLVWAPSVLLADKPEKIAVDPDDPAAGESVVEGLLQLMRQANQEVLIVSPYFVPGRQMMDTFAQLRARGVPVRVLTNSLASTDAPAAHAGYARHRPDLLRIGVELHEMHGDLQDPGTLLGSSAGTRGSRASLHTKAVVVDRRRLVIGSMNLDLRSQLQNSEVALVIRSRTLSQETANWIGASLSRSAWRVILDRDGRLLWRAPAGADWPDSRSEPDAPAARRWLVRLLGPFAPDEML